MKTLIEYANDLRSQAELLLETASALEAHAREQAVALAGLLGIEAPQQSPRPYKRKLQGAAQPSTALTKEQKSELVQEYALIPPEKRTIEMRRALALKWRVTPQQFFLITMSPEERSKRASGARKARAVKRSSEIIDRHIANAATP